MKTCKDAVIEAVTELGGIVTNRDVINYIYKKHPNKPWKEVSIKCHLIGLSVNHPSSKHYPTLHRQACLFSLGQGEFRLSDDQKVDVNSTDESFEDGVYDEIVTETIISFEKDLEEYIVHNLNQIETGLELYSESGITGRQFNTEVGRIDILALDSKKNLVVIELKAGRANYSVIGQILGYISWIRKNIAKGKNIRGIIIASDFDKKTVYAISEMENVVLKKYTVNFSFQDVA